jgi:hypothetical protein
VFSAFKG